VKARRGHITDEYVEDGQAAVLVGTEVIVLSPLATVLLGLIGDDWVDVRVVTKELVRAFGEPAVPLSADAATAEALRALAAHRLVELNEVGEL
jgi:hypothetical protein